MELRKAYEICTQKAKLHMQVKEDILYECKECKDGKYEKRGGHLSGYWNWLTSCAVGMMPIMAEVNRDVDALEFAKSLKKYYQDKVNRYPVETTHDIGFLYLPYSVYMYELTGDPEHRECALKAADALAKRFFINGRFIEAWRSVDGLPRHGTTVIDSSTGEGWLIIDSMMNVPLLLWAWKESGYLQYREIAEAHIRTCIKTLVREDYSVCHAFMLDTQGINAGYERNSCGYANGSHWARGTAWMVYGLVAAYRYTQKEEYLDLAEKIGNKFIDCLTEEDYIPVWDFRLPEDKPAKCRGKSETCEWDESIPQNKKYNRDTSAAATMSCAFIAFNRVRENRCLAEAADKMLYSLTENYLNCDTEIPGMLRCSNGSNGYTIYGDYYYFAALAMKVYGIKGCW